MRFQNDEKALFKFLGFIALVSLVGALLLSLGGCSVMTIRKQKSIVDRAENVLIEANRVVGETCNDPESSPKKQELCEVIREGMALLQEGLGVYREVLIAVENGEATEDKVADAIIAVGLRATTLEMRIRRLIETVD
ncbi:MAG: hypothetical protein ACE5HR_00040 [bacterium]